MATSSNKSALTDFVSNYVVNHAANSPEITTNVDRRIYLSGGFIRGNIVKCISHGVVSEVPELYSTQEEADTRIFLHASYFDQEMGRCDNTGKITIKSPDADVLVFAVHYFEKMFQHRSDVGGNGNA